MAKLISCGPALAALLIALPLQHAPAASGPVAKTAEAKSGDPAPATKKKKAMRRSFKEREESDSDKAAPKTLENAYSIQPNVPAGPGGGQPPPITNGGGEHPDSN